MAFCAPRYCETKARITGLISLQRVKVYLCCFLFSIVNSYEKEYSDIPDVDLQELLHDLTVNQTKVKEMAEERAKGIWSSVHSGIDLPPNLPFSKDSFEIASKLNGSLVTMDIRNARAWLLRDDPEFGRQWGREDVDHSVEVSGNKLTIDMNITMDNDPNGGSYS